jgi:7-cyano-7-deazaguanine synthase
MDSAALAAREAPDLLVTIDYGHCAAEGELRAASTLAQCLRLSHEILQVDCSDIGSGDLAGSAPLPFAPASDWWPFRNQFLITVAAGRAITIGADRLLIGTVRSDAVHEDGRPEFIEAMDSLLRMQEGRLRLVAPAITLTTVELIRSAGLDASLLAWAHSCHKAPWSCGQCRGCQKRRDVWSELEW